MTRIVTPDARRVLDNRLASDTGHRAFRISFVGSSPDEIVIVHDRAVVGGAC